MDCLTGMKADWSHGQLHTIVITDANHFTKDQRLARDILFCLGYTVAQARRQYGVSGWWEKFSVVGVVVVVSVGVVVVVIVG